MLHNDTNITTVPGWRRELLNFQNSHFYLLNFHISFDFTNLYKSDIRIDDSYVFCDPIYLLDGMHNPLQPITGSQLVSLKIRRFSRILEIATFMVT